MRDVVRSSWLAFTGPLEGAAVPCLYNDVRGMTTIAWGNLVNSVGAVIGLPFVWPDGRRATTAEIASAWQSVHNDPQAAIQGWRYAARLTPLRLTPEGIESVVWGRLESNDRILRAHLTECWDDLPACAQNAIHSLAWACGADAHYPRLFQAVADGDFSRVEIRVRDGKPVEVCVGGAELEIHINEWTPEGIHNKGLIPRNIANKILMRNAQRVRDFKLDPDTLDWTHVLGASDAVTVPALPEDTDIVRVDPSLYDLGTEPPESEPA